MEQLQYREGAAAAGESAREPGGGLALLMEEWAHGVVVATIGGSVVHANGAARRELERRHPVELREDRLHARDPENAARLHDAFLRATGGKRGLVTLASSAGRPVTLAVLPLRDDAESPVRHVAFVFERAAVCDAMMLGFFARSHRLTPAEEQVLGILCQGWSAPEIAQQLKVAVSTVRSHIRSLCNKTGASSVREVVGRVAVLPPMLPASQVRIH